MLIGYTGCALSATGQPVGVKGVGKDTAAQLLSEHASRRGWRCVHMSFADALKNWTCDFYGLDRAAIDTPEAKEVPLRGYRDWTFRRLLEVIGTDVVRKQVPVQQGRTRWMDVIRYRILDELATPWEQWVARIYGFTPQEQHDVSPTTALPRFQATRAELMEQLAKAMDEASLPMPRVSRRKILIQITDVRFADEFEMIKSLQGHILQIQRTTPAQTPTAHVSNQVLPQEPDCVVSNQGTRAELQKKLAQWFDDESYRSGLEPTNVRAGTAEST